MAEFDRAAVESGIPAALLMERAGVHAAELLLELHGRPFDRPVLVVAGPGNNGGDGMVLARTLAAWGVPVHVLRPRKSIDDRHLLRGFEVAVHDASAMTDETLHALFQTASIVVDALLGTGLTEAPREDATRIIEAFAVAKGPVVALDVPSGVLSDDGTTPGAAVTADTTLAFGFPKLGTLLLPGRSRSGRILALEIGFPPVGSLPWFEALTPRWAGARRPRRRPDAHKNRAGVVTVVAGREGMAGAAILAARSALRSGAGYVRLVAPVAIRDAVQSALPEVVFVDRSRDGEVGDAFEAAGALVVGPGMGTDADARTVLHRVLLADRPAVVDADALTLVASDPELLPADAASLVWTPHPGEAARLLGEETADVQHDRTAALDRLRDRLGGTVVLKGAPTLVSDGERRLVDTLGSSDLAVAGMGDTLAGAIGSLLAQGAAPLAAAGIGLVSTATAAGLAGYESGLQAADVADRLPEALGTHPPDPVLAAPFVHFDLAPAR